MTAKPLKVLMVVGLVAGGAGRHARELVGDLTDDGYTVDVACPQAVEYQYEFADTGATIHQIAIAARPRPVQDARTVRRLRRIVDDYDVIHAHGLRAAGLVALAGGRPLVATLHNAAPAGRASRRVFTGLLRLTARRADVLLAVSPDIAGDARRLGAKDVRAAVIAAPAAPELDPSVRDRTRVQLGVEDDALIALTVGRLAEQKDQLTLLDAIAAALADDRLPEDFRLFIAGEGPLREELAGTISAGRLPVELLGHRTDVPDLFAACDLVVSSAQWEGQPVWLQEALQAGRAVIATDVGGTAAVLGGAARLVPPADPPALAVAIGEVCDDPELREQLAAQSVSRAAELPTTADAALAAQDVYRDVVAATR